jgi:hypothetical protein
MERPSSRVAAGVVIVASLVAMLATRCAGPRFPSLDTASARWNESSLLEPRSPIRAAVVARSRRSIGSSGAWLDVVAAEWKGSMRRTEVGRRFVGRYAQFDHAAPDAVTEAEFEPWPWSGRPKIRVVGMSPVDGRPPTHEAVVLLGYAVAVLSDSPRIGSPASTSPNMADGGSTSCAPTESETRRPGQGL